MLLERLKSGKVVAAAKSSTWQGDRRIRATDEILIDAAHWQSYSPTMGFWEIGDIKFDLGHVYNSYASVSIWYHGIRFEPEGIRAIIPAGTAKSEQEAPASGTEPEPKGPRVSDAHLRAWFEFYKAVTTGTEDTEDYAWSHARRCFPGKTVSRDRVRAIRGSQRRGPKVKREPAK